MTNLPTSAFVVPPCDEPQTFDRVQWDDVPNALREAALAALSETVAELAIARRDWSLFVYRDDTPTTPGIHLFRTGAYSRQTPDTIYLNATVPLGMVRGVIRHEVYHAWQHEQGQPYPWDEDAAYRFAGAA